jgi:CheY-like chemotaxis protein
MGERATKVLIIDDNEVDRYLYRHFLEQRSSGYEVHEAEDGERGLVMIQQVNPDCVLLDLRLRSESGYEVLRAIVGDEPPPKRPVIMLSELGWTAFARGARSLGAYTYLVKSKTNAELLSRTIREAIAAPMLQGQR